MLTGFTCVDGKKQRVVMKSSQLCSLSGYTTNIQAISDSWLAKAPVSMKKKSQLNSSKKKQNILENLHRKPSSYSSQRFCSESTSSFTAPASVACLAAVFEPAVRLAKAPAAKWPAWGWRSRGTSLETRPFFSNLSRSLATKAKFSKPIEAPTGKGSPPFPVATIFASAAINLPSICRHWDASTSTVVCHPLPIYSLSFSIFSQSTISLRSTPLPLAKSELSSKDHKASGAPDSLTVTREASRDAKSASARVTCSRTQLGKGVFLFKRKANLVEISQVAPPKSNMTNHLGDRPEEEDTQMDLQKNIVW